MLKFLPILLVIAYGILSWQMSARQTMRHLRQRSTRLRDPALEPVTRRLARALDLAEVPVYVYDQDAVNGLAAPDGRIYLTRGFLARYHAGLVTAEELGGVIAHELGHVALGHSRRRAIDFAGQNAVRVVLATLSARFLPGIGPWAVNMLTALVAARLSRRDEYQADEYASALLLKAGIGTAAQKSLLDKLHRLTGSGARPPAWLMSHPETADRIAAIVANERKWAVTETRAADQAERS